MTMPRTSRADRRREGLLPSGEDPMLRRPPDRPAGGPPAGSGRRRTDLDPNAAPGRPPISGERRQLPPAQAPAGPVHPFQRAAAIPPPSPVPSVSGPMTAATPVVPGPMTAATPAVPGPVVAAGPATEATVRPAPPSPRRDDVPARGATARGATAWGAPALGALPPDTAGHPPLAPETTGMPSWAADPAPPTPPPLDVTQRVSGAIPADSPWGPAPTAGPVERPAAAGPAPARPVRTGAPVAPPVQRAAPPAPDVPEQAADPLRDVPEVTVGGRAAARLERQAAEAARKKAGRRTGPPSRPDLAAQTGPGRAAEEPRRAPRRLVQGLVAMVVVAVGVLGFWSFSAPGTQETSAQTTVPSSAPASTAVTPPAPESVPPPVDVAQEPAAPVRAPITVLNSTQINGLAADVGDQFAAGGWEVAGTGASPVQDVATTTVYYTEGDTTGQQAAAQLVDQFPDVTGPVPRYFDVPGDPSLVVVTTGNWTP